MLSKNTQIFASFHVKNKDAVQSMLEQIKNGGWQSIETAESHSDKKSVLQAIEKSNMALVFLSREYSQNEALMFEEFAYAATVVRKPYYPIWLDSIDDIRKVFKNAGCDKKLLSALEMLTAQHDDIANAAELISKLEGHRTDERNYSPSKPQLCEKPCEAYEGDEPYLFISYAHDDARVVYPVIKGLYKDGWDLWYDEGISISERYLPVIAHSLNRSTIFVLMLTNRCLERPFIMNFELEYAKQLGMPIITVLLEDIKPDDWSKEVAARLMETAILPDALDKAISDTGLLTNRGKRTAVPPAVKNNVIYDVVSPPPLPGFEYSVQSDEITITKYVGEDTDVTVPGTVVSEDGSIEIEFKVTVFGKKLFPPYHEQERVLNSEVASVAISENVTVIEDGAFYGCSSLKHVTLPNTLKSVGELAFCKCSELESITIPDSVEFIGDAAFAGCSKLKTINLPQTLTHLARRIFGECISLENLSIPDSVEFIGDAAFAGCSKLKTVNLSQTLTYLASGVFSECISLESISIPGSVTEIEYSAFYGCKSLKSVTIENGVKILDYQSFGDCVSLKSIVIPDSVIGIHEDAFKGCESLNIVFPKSKSNDTLIMSSDTWYKRFEMKKRPFVGSGEGEVIGIPLLPKSKEKHYALVCCAQEDVPHVTTLLTELYWEGFNVHYSDAIDSQKIEDSSCVLAFISENTEKSIKAMEILDIKIKHDPSEIIQVFIKGCFKLPESIRSKLHDRQAIFENQATELAYMGQIREGLRKFKCSLGNPRGFDIRKIDGGVEIAKFNPTGFPNVIIPKTFSDPPLPVISIGHSAFRDYRNLTSVALPDSVTNIGRSAFRDCRDLTSIALPDSVTSIGPFAFRDCRLLTSIALPDSVTSIGESAFYECSSLCNDYTRVFIPKNVSHIGARAFSNCKSLYFELVVDQDNPYYTSTDGILFNKDKTQLIMYPSGKMGTYEIPGTVTAISDSAFINIHDLYEVTIPDSVTGIGDSAFAGCRNLTNIAIPKSVTDIGEFAFSSCRSFTGITIPDGVTEIKRYLFIGCESLTSITIPDSVTSIGNSAFERCKSLINIIIPDSVISIGNSAFDECSPQLTIYCSENSEAHKYAAINEINFEIV